ncbi:MAG: hypothetical protein AAFY45_18275 [Bacteroidota bacterium]
MRKTLVTLLLLTGVIIAYAQDVATLKSQLIGEWVFDTMVLPEDAPEEEKSKMEMMNRMMGNVKMLYQEDGRYLMDGFGKSEEGNWTIEEPGTHIKFVNDKGQENNIEFKFDENGMLHTTVGSSGAAMRLMHPEETLGLTISQQPEGPEVVKTSAEALAKKWFIVDRIKADGKPVTEMSLKLTAGSFMDFRPDGSHAIHILSIDQEGEWKFDEESSMITTILEGESKEWYVLEISDTELKLLQGKKGDTYMFSTTSPEEE